MWTNLAVIVHECKIVHEKKNSTTIKKKSKMVTWFKFQAGERKKKQNKMTTKNHFLQTQCFYLRNSSSIRLFTRHTNNIKILLVEKCPDPALLCCPPKAFFAALKKYYCPLFRSNLYSFSFILFHRQLNHVKWLDCLITVDYFARFLRVRGKKSRQINNCNYRVYWSICFIFTPQPNLQFMRLCWKNGPNRSVNTDLL